MLIRAEWVVPVAEPPIRDGAVLVEGDAITAVGPFERVRQLAGRDEVLDLGPAVLLPGLIDAHSHVGLTVLRGLEDDATLFAWMASAVLAPMELMDERDLLWSARLGCLEAIRAGITCLADCTPTSHLVARALSEAGLRGVVYQEVFQGGREPEEALESTLKRLEEAERCSSGLVRLGLSPHSPYANPPELLKLVAQVAHERGLPLALHLAETKAEVEYFTRGTGELAMISEALGLRLPKAIGKTPAQYLADLGLSGPETLLAHCVHLSDRDIALLAELRAPVVHCPKSNAKLGSGIARVPEMLSSGLTVALGTDSAASNNVLDMFEEMRMAIFLQRASRASAPVLRAGQALEMATAAGAKALGLADLVGTLKPGRKADLVAVRLREGLLPTYDPVSTLVYCASRADVVLTMVNGRVLYKDGQFTTLDAERVLKECVAIGERLAEELVA